MKPPQSRLKPGTASPAVRAAARSCTLRLRRVLRAVMRSASSLSLDPLPLLKHLPWRVPASQGATHLRWSVSRLCSMKSSCVLGSRLLLGLEPCCSSLRPFDLLPGNLQTSMSFGLMRLRQSFGQPSSAQAVRMQAKGLHLAKTRRIVQLLFAQTMQRPLCWILQALGCSPRPRPLHKSHLRTVSKVPFPGFCCIHGVS